jgi:SAM-dependent methyltransferase
MGFYPLPPSEGARIRACLSFPPQGCSALDPCVGTGSALTAITAGGEVRLYGVELDADRAATASEAGIKTLHSDAMMIGGSSEQVSLLYLNPPYDFECGVYGNQRLEQRFLESTYRFLKDKGVLVFVIPRKRLEACADFLSSEFKDIQTYLLSDEMSVKFDQVVVFARKGRTDGQFVEKTRRLLNGVSRGIQGIPRLLDGIQPLYEVPRSGEAHFFDKGLPLDMVEDLMKSSAAWTLLKPLVIPTVGVTSGRPLTPLHAGQIALLCNAGLLNGIFGEGEHRHLVRWRTYKYSTTLEEYNAERDENISRTIERFAHDNALVYSDGRTLILTADKETPDSTGAAEGDMQNPAPIGTGPAMV